MGTVGGGGEVEGLGRGGGGKLVESLCHGFEFQSCLS